MIVEAQICVEERNADAVLVQVREAAMVGARLLSYGSQWLVFNATMVRVETEKHGGDGFGLRCARGSGDVAMLQARW